MMLITEALVQLEVTSDRLDYEVIGKGSDGFLGFGRKQAVRYQSPQKRRACSRSKS
ncbi:MAG: Jag N-terminal domain-containing protein [Dorea sp.]